MPHNTEPPHPTLTAYLHTPTNHPDHPRLEDDLLRAHLPFIRGALDRTTLPTGIDTEDLFGYITEWIVRAIRRYDPTRAGFRTFLNRQVTYARAEYLRTQDPLTRTDRARVNTVQAFLDQTHPHHRRPTPQEIAQATNLTVDQVTQALIDANLTEISLDHTPDHHDPHTLRPHDIDTALTTATSDPDALDPHDRAALQQAVIALTDRDRAVFLLYYVEGLSLTQIAAIFDITDTRVSQLLSRARTTIGTHLRTHHQQ